MFKVVLPVAAVSAALILSGCGKHAADLGPEQHESRSIELDKSERVRAEIKLGAGELEVRGGAKNLLDADFTYNDPSAKPEIRYSSAGVAGDLILGQQSRVTMVGNAKNRWDLRFNDRVPLDFRVEFGAGEGRLDLGSLSLRSVTVEMGAGTLEMDLRGSPRNDYSVRIRGGVGEATVHLPKDVGITATATGGLGEISVTGLRKTGDRYVNDAADRSGPKIHLDVQGGVGSIKLIAD